jgi:hypothetical protein
MRRAFMCPLMFTAALIGAAVASSASAQERDVPVAVVERAVPDLSSIETRLRDRGVSEDRIGVSIARLRAAIASGKYPHLERRIYNFPHPDTGDDPNRRRLLAAGDRPADVDPARVRPERRERPERPERPERERPDVERPDVSRADDVRPDFDRPAANIAPVAPRVANARALTAPGLARRQ